jgi:hypothetical protein
VNQPDVVTEETPLLDQGGTPDDVVQITREVPDSNRPDEIASIPEDNVEQDQGNDQGNEDQTDEQNQQRIQELETLANSFNEGGQDESAIDPPQEDQTTQPGADTDQRIKALEDFIQGFANSMNQNQQGDGQENQNQQQDNQTQQNQNQFGNLYNNDESDPYSQGNQNQQQQNQQRNIPPFQQQQQQQQQQQNNPQMQQILDRMDQQDDVLKQTQTQLAETNEAQKEQQLVRGYQEKYGITDINTIRQIRDLAKNGHELESYELLEGKSLTSRATDAMRETRESNRQLAGQTVVNGGNTSAPNQDYLAATAEFAKINAIPADEAHKLERDTAFAEFINKYPDSVNIIKNGGFLPDQ